jgi:hypothetical protein
MAKLSVRTENWNGEFNDALVKSSTRNLIETSDEINEQGSESATELPGAQLSLVQLRGIRQYVFRAQPQYDCNLGSSRASQSSSPGHLARQHGRKALTDCICWGASINESISTDHDG